MKILIAMLLAGTAQADALRFATIAPDGTAWAREVKAFSRDVESLTAGGLRAKWYMGGIAGDEPQVLERIRRGQLDGMAAAHACDQLSPSMRVMHLIGLFRSSDEILYVLGKLRPLFDKEFQQHGFVQLGLGGGFGQTVFFGRQAARTLADLKRSRFWIWELDEVPRMQLAAMGIPLVPLSVEKAARAYDDKQIDGFIAIPTAALAYQWSAQARYFTPLRGGFLPACLTLSTAAFDALPLEQQQALRQASTNLIARFDEVGRSQDKQLLSGLFEKQGLTRIEVSASLAQEWGASAREAREKLGGQLIKPELIREVLTLLEEYRAHH
jgi:TRAP-type C4-dicarboxylate transport system substrate-binding protein